MHAVFTIVQDDRVRLRMWVEHYRRYYRPEDTYVLHQPSAGEPWNAEWVKGVERTTRGQSGEPSFHLAPVFRAQSFDHTWLRETVSPSSASSGRAMRPSPAAPAPAQGRLGDGARAAPPSGSQRWSPEDLELRHGWQNRVTDEDTLRQWWFSIEDTDEPAPLLPIPERVKDNVSHRPAHSELPEW